jgi:hypothetical protein
VEEMAAKRFELYMNFTIMFSLLLDQSLLQAEILNLDRYDSEFQIDYMICALNDFFILFRAKCCQMTRMAYIRCVCEREKRRFFW